MRRLVASLPLGAWAAEIVRPAKLCLRSIFPPFLGQWNHHWPANRRKTVLAGRIFRLERFLRPTLLALLLAACSPTPAPPSAADGQSAPADAALGSAAWYAWVGGTLGISDKGHGSDPGSDEWNQAVQRKLGEEAPRTKPGSPQWQQSVDALLRTRIPPAS